MHARVSVERRSLAGAEEFLPSVPPLLRVDREGRSPLNRRIGQDDHFCNFGRTARCGLPIAFFTLSR